MKKMIIIMTAAALLMACSGSGNDELFDSWKAWVAVNSAYLFDDYQNDWKERHGGDPSSLFYENETVVMNIRRRYSGVDTIKCYTSNLAPIGTAIYSGLKNYLISEYKQCVNDFDYKEDNEIISDVIDRFKENYKPDEKGVYNIWFTINGFEMTDEEKETLDLIFPNDAQNLIYNMDWLFKSESAMSTLKQDLIGMCGTFSDFYEFITNAVTVVESGVELNRGKYNVYNVIYHIATDSVSKYALCRILEKEDGYSELELVKSSDNLLDLY